MLRGREVFAPRCVWPGMSEAQETASESESKVVGEGKGKAGGRERRTLSRRSGKERERGGVGGWGGGGEGGRQGER